ncbi:MAG: hypothetical protein WCS99_05205 [Limisphaerales bacterium]
MAIETKVGVWVLEKGIELVKDKFKERVIERWTRYRAERFFAAFTQAIQQELATGKEEAKVDSLLNEIYADEERTEVLFDAYRKVSFAASKTLGPRVIGLLVGKLCCEGRRANSGEEQILMAAEQMTDSELYDLFKYYAELRMSLKDETNGGKRTPSGIEITLSTEKFDSVWGGAGGSENDASPVDLDEALGRWALKLKHVGLLKDKLLERHSFTGDESEWRSEKGSILQARRWLLVFTPQCEHLAELVERAFGAAQSAGDKV